ncbi:MAG: zinc-dependent peptidase [Planctomycetota bacterium]
MLPTPERVRRNRRWSASLALAAAVGAAALAWSLVPGPTLFAILLSAALGVGAAVYRNGTRRTRKRIELLKEPFPPAWEGILAGRVAFYRRLGEAEKARFRRMVFIFLREKPIHGAGFTVDEVSRVLVAASAVIPVFGFSDWEYDMLDEIVLRPESFDTSDEARTGLYTGAVGLVGASGLMNGLMVLSDPELRRGFEGRGEKHNVGIHEFAHLVDKAKGRIDGVPAGLPPGLFRPWLRVMREMIRQGSLGAADFPDYGFTSDEEFFAVASEYFFEAPGEMEQKHPELYGLLERVYRQDTGSLFQGLVERVSRPRRRRIRGNAPCPCGSGLKYKRCCGRGKRPTPRP